MEIGLKIGSTIEYIPIGIYNIDDIEKTDYTIKITAFDNMIKFEKNFTTTIGDNLTLQQVVSELTRITGVEFTGNLPSYTVKTLEGFTCREVLGYVASLCGGNAVITRDGKFTIVTLKDVNYSIGTSNYFDYKREETKYKIGKISCQAGEEVLSKGSLGVDSMELQFENPWINTTILTDIYNKLNGFEYLGYSMKWQGDISLDAGDIVTITDKKGVVRKHPILSQKFTYTGGLTSEIGAKGENKNKNEFSSSGSTAKKVERVVMELALINKALIDVAYIGDLTAGNIKFDTASGNIMDLQTLLAKFVTGENGQFLNLTTDNVTISNAVIKDVIAKNISVGDLKASAIDTSIFNVVSKDGGLSIVGSTMQFKDSSNVVQMQLGRDAQGKFTFFIKGEGNKGVLIDGTGLKQNAIVDDLIVERMINENAVGEKQINYSSLITGLNKDTNTSLIQASKVAIDLTGQSLEVSFNSLKSNVDNMEIGGRNLLKLSSFNIPSYETTLIKDSQGIVAIAYGIGNDLYESGEYIISFLIKSKFSKDRAVSAVRLSQAEENSNSFSTIAYIGKGRNKSETWDKVVFKFTLTNKKRLGLQIYNHDFLTDFDNEVYVKDIKIEKGNKATDWTPAPEDIDKRIESNTTSISVVQGKIDALISENSIIKGDVTTLKDNYTSVKATVDGISTTVSSHTTSISTLTSNVGTAQTLADSKAKVYTSTPTTPYKIGDLWVQGTTGDIMRCKVARASGSYNAADWEKAAKYTDDTKANSVEGSLNTLGGRVTTVESNYSTLSQDVSGFKTTVSNTYSTKTELSTLDGKVNTLTNRVSTAENKITADAIVSTVRSSTAYTTDLSSKANQSSLNTTNSNVSGLTSRVNTVEQSITATAITTTISSAINAGTSSISTTQFVMDKTGLTIKNGALTIKNKAGTNVLTSDTSGNLTIEGNFITNRSGQKAVEIVSQSINLYDWEGTTRTTPVGSLFSGRRIINGSTSSLPGYVISNEKSAYLSLAYKNDNGKYSDYILLDRDGISGQGGSFPIWVQENMIVNATLGIRGATSKTYSRMWNTNNTLVTEINTANAGNGYQIQTTSGSVLFSIIAGRSYTINQTATQINGNLTVTGSKNSLQKTENYGEILINAYETAEYFFGDIGSGIIKEGECIVWIDEILKECINTDIEYHIFTQAYQGSINKIERYKEYFIVRGENNTEFSWELKAKRKGYENVRLDEPSIGTIQDIATFTEEDLKTLTSEDILLNELNYKLEDILLEEVV